LAKSLRAERVRKVYALSLLSILEITGLSRMNNEIERDLGEQPLAKIMA